MREKRVRNSGRRLTKLDVQFFPTRGASRADSTRLAISSTPPSHVGKNRTDISSMYRAMVSSSESVRFRELATRSLRARLPARRRTVRSATLCARAADLILSFRSFLRDWRVRFTLASYGVVFILDCHVIRLGCAVVGFRRKVRRSLVGVAYSNNISVKFSLTLG